MPTTFTSTPVALAFAASGAERVLASGEQAQSDWLLKQAGLLVGALLRVGLGLLNGFPGLLLVAILCLGLVILVCA